MGFVKIILAVASVIYGFEAGNEIRRKRRNKS